jgi:hypothetical protein
MSGQTDRPVTRDDASVGDSPGCGQFRPERLAEFRDNRKIGRLDAGSYSDHSPCSR